jgi:hypothetical protein
VQCWLAGFALVQLLASCSTLHDSQGCPRPCPFSCPASCLPSGYCEEVVVAVPATPPSVVGVGIAWEVTVGDLPPNAKISLSFHGVLDLVERGGRLPWTYWIEAHDPAWSSVVPALDLASPNTSDFPVLAAFSRDGLTDANGGFQWRLDFVRCAGRTTRNECLLLPGTTVTVRLQDPSPWSLAPACQ